MEVYSYLLEAISEDDREVIVPLVLRLRELRLALGADAAAVRAVEGEVAASSPRVLWVGRRCEEERRRHARAKADLACGERRPAAERAVGRQPARQPVVLERLEREPADVADDQLRQLEATQLKHVVVRVLVRVGAVAQRELLEELGARVQPLRTRAREDEREGEEREATADEGQGRHAHEDARGTRARRF